MPALVPVADVTDAWSASAEALYSCLERELFGLSGLRTGGVRTPEPGVVLSVRGKELARVSARGDGLEVTITVPKRFKERVADLPQLTAGVRRALKVPDKAHVPVLDEADAAAIAALVREKADR